MRALTLMAIRLFTLIIRRTGAQSWSRRMLCSRVLLDNDHSRPIVDRMMGMDLWHDCGTIRTWRVGAELQEWIHLHVNTMLAGLVGEGKRSFLCGLRDWLNVAEQLISLQICNEKQRSLLNISLKTREKCQGNP